jgi:hypothetical protein
MTLLLLTFGMTCAGVYEYFSEKFGLLFQAHMLHFMGHDGSFSKVTGYRLDAWSSVHGRCIGISLLMASCPVGIGCSLPRAEMGTC